MLAFKVGTASELWASSWHAVSNNGTNRPHSRGSYREVLHAVFELEDPRQRWTMTRSPAINPAFALVEVIWILKGRSDSAFLTPWNRSLSKYAGDKAKFYGAYGERLRKRFNFDQLLRAADVLATNSEQRQVVLQIWDPQTDFPHANGRSRARDIPCNVSSMIKVVDGRLEWLQVMRSNDLVRGLPYNIVQWTTLQEIIAGWLGLNLGSYVHISDSLHVYDHDSDSFTSNDRSIMTSDRDLRLLQPDSQHTFDTLESAAEEMAHAVDVESVHAHSRALPTSSPYSDWLMTLAAERIRRLGDANTALNLVSAIQDAPLRDVASRWISERNASRG